MTTQTQSTLSYAVIPGPGMYGDGMVSVYSRHRSAEAAKRAAKSATRRFKVMMKPYGDTSGYYIAVEWSRSWFWADMPPKALAEA